MYFERSRAPRGSSGPPLMRAHETRHAVVRTGRAQLNENQLRALCPLAFRRGPQQPTPANGTDALRLSFPTAASFKFYILPIHWFSTHYIPSGRTFLLLLFFFFFSALKLNFVPQAGAGLQLSIGCPFTFFLPCEFAASQDVVNRFEIESLIQ